MFRAILGTLLSTWIFSFIVGIAIGGFCFDYCLESYVGKDIHWSVDCVAGAVTCPIVIPGAVVALVLKECDVQTPFFKLDTSIASRYHQRKRGQRFFKRGVN